MRENTKPPSISDIPEQQNLPAGCFSSWLRRTRYALAKEKEAYVHCGECYACCVSSYFIHIRPDEARTLARIPKEILFPAPGLPKGNVLLGYDEAGRCPMLIDGKCSIYEHRPFTCRNYDCRIFAAAGIPAGEDDKALITRHIKRWKFSYPTQGDLNQHTAVQAAAMFLEENPRLFPAGFVTGNSTQLALLAIKVYHVFLKNNASDRTERVSPDNEVAQAIMDAYQKFHPTKNTTQ